MPSSCSWQIVVFGRPYNSPDRLARNCDSRPGSKRHELILPSHGPLKAEASPGGCVRLPSVACDVISVLASAPARLPATPPRKACKSSRASYPFSSKERGLDPSKPHGFQRKLATVVLVKLSVLTASEGPVTSCESAVPETPRASPDRSRLGLEKRRCRRQYRPVRKIR